MLNKPIVFTCANGKFVAKLVRHLSKTNPERKVYGLDAKVYKKNIDSNIFYRFYKVPFPNESEYFTSIKEILNSIGECILIIGSDEEALKLSKYYKELENLGIKLNLMSKDKLTILQNKYEMFSLLSKSDSENKFIKEFSLIKNKKNLLAFSNKINYPNQSIILKPPVGRGSRDVFLISEEENIALDDLKIKKYPLKNITEDFFSKGFFLAMVFFKGKSLTIDVLVDKGKFIQAVPRVWYNGKLEKKIIQKIFYSKKVLELVNFINAKISLHGLLDIDAKIDDKGNIFLLEVNTRPSGSVVASELAGIPIFSMLEKVLEGKNVEKYVLKEQKKVTL